MAGDPRNILCAWKKIVTHYTWTYVSSLFSTREPFLSRRKRGPWSKSKVRTTTLNLFGQHVQQCWTCGRKGNIITKLPGILCTCWLSEGGWENIWLEVMMYGSSRLVPSHYLWVWGKGREDWILSRHAGWHEKERRKSSDWQISYGRDVHSAIEVCSSFFHGKGTELRRYLDSSFREMEVNLSTKSREIVPALFQLRTGVSGRHSIGIWCFRLFTLKVQILWLVANKSCQEIKVSI